MVSLLKEYWGDAATPDNDFCFDYLPRINGDHGTYRSVMDMIDGKVFGYFLLGQNPAVGSARPTPTPRHGQPGLAGRPGPGHDRKCDVLEGLPRSRPGRSIRPESRTEVFFFPAASTSRNRAPSPRPSACCSGVTKPSNHAATNGPNCGSSTTRTAAQGETRRLHRRTGSPPLDLAWDYEMEGDEPSAEERAATHQRLRPEHGAGRQRLHRPQTGRQHLVRLLDLQRGVRRRGQPGGTSAVPAGPAAVRARMGLDLADEPAGPVQPRVGRPQGRPWSERKALVWWDAERGEWTGYDEPDFEKHKPPDYRPPDGAVGPEALRGDDPFIMQADGKGWLFAPNGLQDGPLPTHYEPHESPYATCCTGSRATRPARSTAAWTTRPTRLPRSRIRRCSRSSSPRRG